jgi:hypothetical protein
VSHSRLPRYLGKYPPTSIPIPIHAGSARLPQKTGHNYDLDCKYSIPSNGVSSPPVRTKTLRLLSPPPRKVALPIARSRIRYSVRHVNEIFIPGLTEGKYCVGDRRLPRYRGSLPHFSIIPSCPPLQCFQCPPASRPQRLRLYSTCSPETLTRDRPPVHTTTLAHHRYIYSP